jgi:hypothetical protein
LVDVRGRAIRCTRHHVADVGRHARQAQHAALAIEQTLDRGAVAPLAHEKSQRHGRIQIARARAHHQPLQRRVSHGVVDGSAVHDGAQTGAATAQVATHGVQFLEGHAQQLGCLLCNVLVTGAVKAVLAKAVLGDESGRQGVGAGHLRDGRVKDGVEDHRLWQVGIEAPTRGHQAYRGRVVNGSQLLDALQLGHDRVVEDHMLFEVGPAVRHAVPDGIGHQLGIALEQLHDLREGGGVVRHLHHDGFLLAGHLVVNASR